MATNKSENCCLYAASESIESVERKNSLLGVFEPRPLDAVNEASVLFIGLLRFVVVTSTKDKTESMVIATRGV
jgi:hypothetical protein